MRILLAVCGSISAYKALDLARGLINENHQVRVILTKGAEAFVRPQVFRYLGAQEVYTSQDDFNYPKSENQAEVLHVNLAQWAQRLVVAPLSANTLARLAMGQADDLLTSVFLALPPDRPILFFPAMNTNMLQHPIVQDNQRILERLKEMKQVYFAPTQAGKLACGDEGEGKLLSVEAMLEIIPVLNPAARQNPKKILITTGATLSPLDPVRYLTNPASGLTGIELARSFHAKGHHVTLIHGAQTSLKLEALKALPNFELLQAKTPKAMLDVVQQFFPTTDLFISAAAIGDIEFEAHSQKLKKTTLGDSLPIKKAPDVLATMIAQKKEHQKIVGFAAETQLTTEILQEKMQRKPVDLLIGTQVSSGYLNPGQDDTQGFQKSNALYKILKGDQLFFGGELEKRELADIISQELDL